MVCLDEDGEVVRPALLWNDTRSAGAAARPRRGARRRAQAWADAVGVVPVASFTVTKLRWLAEHEPEHAARTAAVCLPHDWLTWRLAGGTDPPTSPPTAATPAAPATGPPRAGEYRPDLLERAFGARPAAAAGARPERGGRARRAAGARARRRRRRQRRRRPRARPPAPATSCVSIGTSGVVTAVGHAGVRDATGTVAGFADATGRFLPLVCTLNAARVLDATARLLGVDLARLSELALEAPPGADGLVLVPYLEGERTPNLPDATGSLHGPDPGQPHPGPPRPGRRRGHALRARRRPRRAGRHGRRRRAAS